MQSQSGLLELRIETSREGTQISFYITFPTGNKERRIGVLPRRAEVEHALASITGVEEGWIRRGFDDTFDPIREIGTRLFAALFGGKCGPMYEDSLALCEATNKRLCLRVVTDDTELAALPWEFLYDIFRDDFVALNGRATIVREWGTQMRMPMTAPIEPPLRLLIISADSSLESGAAEIDVLHRLHQKWPSLEVDVERNRPLSVVLEELVNGKETHHVIHLIDGDVDSDFELESEYALPVSDLTRRAQIVQRANSSLLGAKLDLSACHLLYLSVPFTDSIASGLSTAFPAVVGMRGRITNTARQSFVQGFYRALLAGELLETAMTRGRQAVDRKRPGRREWGMVVCYMRVAEAVVLTPAVSRGEPTPILNATPGTGATPNADQSERKRRRIGSLLAIHRLNQAAQEEEISRLGYDASASLIAEQNSTIKKIEELKQQLREIT